VTAGASSAFIGRIRRRIRNHVQGRARGFPFSEAPAQRPQQPLLRSRRKKTGQLLVKAGYGVITGGGPRASWKPANKRLRSKPREKSIGLKHLSSPRNRKSNRYLNVSLDFHYFYARKVMFVKYASAFHLLPRRIRKRSNECFRKPLNPHPNPQIDPFPVILLRPTDYWTGTHQMDERNRLAPNFIDLEDMDIFRIVDRPQGTRSPSSAKNQNSPWWRPKRSQIERKPPKTGAKKQTPLSNEAHVQRQAKAPRYGIRPKHIPRSSHIASPAKNRRSNSDKYSITFLLHVSGRKPDSNQSRWNSPPAIGKLFRAKTIASGGGICSFGIVNPLEQMPMKKKPASAGSFRTGNFPPLLPQFLDH